VSSEIVHIYVKIFREPGTFTPQGAFLSLAQVKSKIFIETKNFTHEMFIKEGK